MKTIILNPTWKAAARIYIECLVNGDSVEARKSAEAEIMRMADLLDKVIESNAKEVKSHG